MHSPSDKKSKAQVSKTSSYSVSKLFHGAKAKRTSSDPNEARQRISALQDALANSGARRRSSVDSPMVEMDPTINVKLTDSNANALSSSSSPKATSPKKEFKISSSLKSYLLKILACGLLSGGLACACAVFLTLYLHLPAIAFIGGVIGTVALASLIGITFGAGLSAIYFAFNPFVCSEKITKSKDIKTDFSGLPAKNNSSSAIVHLKHIAPDADTNNAKGKVPSLRPKQSNPVSYH